MHALVEIPCGWYNEDMMALQYLPHLAMCRLVEEMWKDKFMWLWDNSNSEGSGWADFDFIFPILRHPDTSGMAHVIGMAERVVLWLKGWGEDVEFCTHEQIAGSWEKEKEKDNGNGGR